MVLFVKFWFLTTKMNCREKKNTLIIKNIKEIRETREMIASETTSEFLFSPHFVFCFFVVSVFFFLH